MNHVFKKSHLLICVALKNSEGRKIIAIFKLFDRDRAGDNEWDVSVSFGCSHKHGSEVKQKLRVCFYKEVLV